jgi:hypothetical protein
MPFPKPESRAVQKARERSVKKLTRAACVRAVFERAGWRCESCQRPVLRAQDVGATEWNVGHCHEPGRLSLGADGGDESQVVLLCLRCHNTAHGLNVAKS